ncbi:hypothetical protein [Formosa sp. L2A11]|uniref:hypothetical protein n=1 Tax=Formosa sp. L2A11 TaxID=2686363 RepID=UPI00131C5E16|nr:hypothetical protein [Formosa sp. L2A11]
MKNQIIFIFLLLIFQSCLSQKKEKDTIYILFNAKEEGMIKDIIPKQMLTVKGVSPVDNSFTYEIDEKKDGFLYEYAYIFSHFNWSSAKTLFPENYRAPLILKKDISFLNKIDVLENNFFKNTNYKKVCKVFEKEDSREVDVIIFIIDVAEMNTKEIVLREVLFNRPIKE